MTSSATPPTKAEQLAALRKVQRRVGAIAFFAVAIHGVLGLVVVADVVMGQGRDADAVLLLILSGVFAILTVLVMRLILGAKLLTWWIPVSLLPTVYGFLTVL
jgi:hypothetical protein